MPISIHTIRAAEKGGSPFVEVPIAGWGDVRLQRLQPHQREKFADLLAGKTSDGLLGLVCTTAVSDAGALLFAEAADRALLESREDAVAKLGAAAVKLNSEVMATVKEVPSVTK